MKKTFRNRFITKASRFKRRSGYISQEVTGAMLLIGCIFLITASLIYACNVLLSTPYFWIKKTVVSGCKELTEKDILTLASVKPTQSMLSVSVKTMAGRIKANPWIKDVSIAREFPDQLVISIKEKKPVAVIHKEQGFFLMDDEGAAIKKVETPDEADLPVVTGIYSNGKEHKQLVKKTLTLLGYITTSRAFPAVKNISEIHGDDAMGISIYTGRGICLNMGFDDYETKLIRLDTVIADLERKKQKLDYANIDLSDLKRITVQRRKVSAAATEQVVQKEGFKI